VRRNKYTAAVQRAFGISPDEINHDIVEKISFSIAPGQVAMIVGPSGSGKTSLLSALKSVKRRKDNHIKLPRDARLGTFEPIRSRKPLIESLGVEGDISKALRLMGTVGLSDAFIYLKKFDELSAGQQYRAMLAKLISSNANVWLADEFCVNLDPIAANVVAERLGALARNLKAALIVATPQPELVARSLKPDVVIRLTTAWEHQVLKGDEFIENLIPGPPAYKAPRFGVPPAVFKKLAGKIGSCTFLLPNSAPCSLGTTLVGASGKSALITVHKARRFPFAELNAADARAAGFVSRKAAFKNLRRKKRMLSSHSLITLVEASLLRLTPV
jgi:ABC-type lipoprotein export system ATPase subunit